MKTEYFKNLDGLRAFAALGVIIMHVAANGGYSMDSYLYSTIIGSFYVFVQLFFIISGFSMCCGYYERLKNNEISLNDFYNKRYMKILPFFTVLVLIDLLFNWNGMDSVFEGLADVTLLFGFLPNSNITVIGVGWALGVIFAFYCLFPFFVYLLWNKKRAWFSLLVSLFLNYACEYYFLVDGNAVSCNLIRWLCYFIMGGLLYLYKKEIMDAVGKRKTLFLLFTIAITVVWYMIPDQLSGFYFFTLKTGIMFSVWVMYSISCKSHILSNRITAFISGISFEIYLAHMAVFRIVQKLGLTHLLQNDVLAYITTCCITIGGVIIFSMIVKKSLEYTLGKIEAYKDENTGRKQKQN